MKVRLQVNGTTYSLDLDPRTSLLDALRDGLHLFGTKKGCNQGACGACTVLVEGERINSCLALAVQYAEREITTIEGLGSIADLHVLQESLISRADRLRLRVDGGAGDRRALARRPDDSGDGLQFRHRAGGVSGARAAGALVLGTARTKEKAAAACATFPGKAVGYACELSDPSSVRGCVAAVKADGHRLDAIICNAGIMMLPKLEKSHGYELQFFTNYIGHFMLVTGLLEQLKDEGRVVMLSSEGHRSAPVGAIEFDNLSGDEGYKPLAAYGQSKMADLLFVKELQRRLPAPRGPPMRCTPA